MFTNDTLLIPTEEVGQLGFILGGDLQKFLSSQGVMHICRNT